VPERGRGAVRGGYGAMASVREDGDDGDIYTAQEGGLILHRRFWMTAEGSFRHFLFDLNIPNWPVDEDGDSLDLENLLIIGVSERGIEFCCGGDWQEPQRLLLTPDLDVIGVEGPTDFSDIEVDEESLAGLDAWLEARA